MANRCVAPPNGHTLWTRVEGLLKRRDSGGQALVSRIPNSELQTLLAQLLGYVLAPGAVPLAPICAAAGDGLLVGYRVDPRAVLHRTPTGAVHVLGELAELEDIGAAIDNVVAALEVSYRPQSSLR